MISMLQREVTKELEQNARSELTETYQTRVETLKHISEWIIKQPHIKFRTDELWLLNFIRGCKFSTQKVKQKIDWYLKTKSEVPELFLHRDPFLPSLQNMLMKSMVIPFCTPDKDCVIISFEHFNPHKDLLIDLMKLATMFFDIFLNESKTTMIVGHYAIIDCAKFSASLLPQLTPSNLKRIVHSTLLVYPPRVKTVCFINCVPMLENVYNLSKYIISDKIQNRIRFYGNDYNKIYETIPKKYFPNEYGGCAGSLNELSGGWKKKIESYRQWYLDDAKYSSDDIKEIKTISNITCGGIDGCFRKLDLD